jgi:hypothetical protein
MNSPFVLEQARAMAARANDPDPAERIAALYRLAYSRAPTADEQSLATEFVKSPAEKSGLSSWEQLAQVLLLSNEFTFVD